MKTMWQLYRTEEEMQHTTRKRGAGLGRGMQEKRAHDDYPSFRGETLNLTVLVPDSMCCLRRKAPEPVRFRDDPEGSVFRTARIEMEPHSDEALEHRHGRLHEQRTFLLSPTRAPGIGNARTNGNAQILVQRNEPVLLTRFVENGALNDCGGTGEEAREVFVGANLIGERLAPGVVKEISASGVASGNVGELLNDNVAFGGRQ